MMSQVQAISGRGIPLVGDDIDTDRIIPARFLKCVTFDGLGTHAFEDDRAQLQGQHPFDQPQYQGAEVLVVNRNFGCGSSREHAPQAIAKWGIKALVGESFAEIFFGNCVAMGIPCVTATGDDVKALQGAIAAHPQATVTVDLSAMTATCGDLSIPVLMGEGPRQMFLSGSWDATGQLVAQTEQIKATAAKLPYVAWSHA
ncbi:3-isopropylmalate dehydratase small subunit [Thermoleptolyngbya sp. C42_A2020_037]|uniref:3-isopropylmalate dehydratase small subunit n=1 Tax=Thermoleptolyngbya sp. C42_A2020_037 TaxID=2747799 RepID=UPI0019D97647|nr:3-isopropylmalate dehydratase small subunit [Thermoleptolyngbya sp. C42_A2020_037]MBF2084394.1 3-isopropylmalate dehydratase small subunit [Thermoleptolyngbya sp. C42_A2020_037]